MKTVHRAEVETGERPESVSQGQKRLYEAPELVEWGSILNLTKGAIFGGQDDGISGTGGV